MITVNAFLVTLVLTLVLPVINGLVTKYHASPALKQAVLVVTSGVASLINASITVEGSAVFSRTTLLLWGMTLLGSLASYLGIYQPHDLNAYTKPDRGLGGYTYLDDDDDEDVEVDISEG